MQKVICSFLIGAVFVLVATNPIKAQETENLVQFINQSHIPGYNFRKKQNASVFQGNRKKKQYFEGWYFKMVSTDGTSILSVIPGISLPAKDEKPHAFIQVIDGNSARTAYFTFPMDDFYFSPTNFAVRIGSNFFSEDSLVLNLINDSVQFRGTLYLSGNTPLTLGNSKKKHIMGWYRLVPFMQCYHGVVSLNHQVSGNIIGNNHNYRFKQGQGYIEKDWGKSMPSAWIWLQSNNFNTPKTSFMLSVAHVPWMGASFTGFLGFFYHDSLTQRFGTYTHAKIQFEHWESDTLKITIRDKKYTYSIKTFRQQAGFLKAPVNGSMDRRIAESIDAKLHICVTTRKGKLIFSDSTQFAGLEMVGDFESLNTKRKHHKKSSGKKQEP